MFKRFTHYAIPATIAVVLFSFMFLAGFFEKWNLQLTDLLFTPQTPSDEIAIIAIDDRSIRELGPFPWKRSLYADLLKTLDSASPSAIGINVPLSERSNSDEDAKFSQQLELSKQVVLAVEGTDAWNTEKGIVFQKMISPIPDFATHAKTGLVNLIVDADTVVRQLPLRVDGRGYESLTGFAFTLVNQHYQSINKPQLTLASIPLSGGMLRIRYAGKPGTYPHYSFIDVLNGRVDPQLFTNKMVLVGMTSLDLHDDALTPLSTYAMSGIEIQANAINTLLQQRYLTKEHPVITLITVILFCYFVAFLFSQFRISVITIVTILLLTVWLCYVYISFELGFIPNIIYPLMAIVYTFVIEVLYKYFQETRQKRFIKKAFSYYLSESVLSEMLNNPQSLSLGGKRQEITVLFSDIAGFTSMAEKLDPEILSTLLNRYLTDMTDIVFQYSGVLDKYIGDAVMAFWNAPKQDEKHALHACKTALAMQEKITHLKKDWRDHGIEDFSVRIGINTGSMIVGNMGSSVRFEYTLLGDNVNIGARLEGLNKEYGTTILITGATYKDVREFVVAREIDTVAVKGKAHGITVYELRHMGNPTSDEMELLPLFEKARKLYQYGKFKMALAAFQAVEKKYPFDSPTQMYIKRCQYYIKNRPAEWDGVYRKTTK